MSGFDQSLLDTIDARVAKALAGMPDLHPATMTARDTSGSGGQVTFFGSGLSVAVKVPATVHAFPGDAVGVARFGPSDWIVVYSFGRWGESVSSVRVDLATGSRGVNSFADMPGSPSFTFRKRYDATRVHVTLATGMFANAAAESDFSAQFDDGAGTVADHQLFTVHLSSAAHQYGAGGDILSGLPAALYTVTARWRTNTGTMSCNSADSLFMTAREIGPVHP
jgi:hypothetical protein